MHIGGYPSPRCGGGNVASAGEDSSLTAAGTRQSQVQTPSGWSSQHAVLARVNRHVGSLAFRGNLGNSHPGNIVSMKTFSRFQIKDKRKFRTPPRGQCYAHLANTIFPLRNQTMKLTCSSKSPSYTVMHVTNRLSPTLWVSAI